MTAYKTIVTLTWKFESEKGHEESLALAKQQLEQILNCNPHGDPYDGFCVQVDLARMKERKKLIHIAAFDPQEIFPHISVEDTKRSYDVGDKTYVVRMNSDRYHVFKANQICVACGLVGSKMILDINPGDQSPHFNLYAEEAGRLVLMTKDHILAKSRGGEDVMDNFQVMCAPCNNLKGAYNLTMENVRELRWLLNNNEKLPKKELRDLINRRREALASGSTHDRHQSEDFSQEEHESTICGCESNHCAEVSAEE